MRTRLLGALVGLAISLALPTFAQQKETVDPQLIQKLDDTLNKKYPEAINSHDAATIGAQYTDDAIFVTVTGPVYGRKAIEKWYEDALKGVATKNNTATTDPHSVRMLGPDYLTASGEWSDTHKGENGEDVPIKGYWSEICTRQGDAWKLCLLTWNITPAPAAASSPTVSPRNQQSTEQEQAE